MINSGIANRRQPFAGAVVPGELNLAYARVIGQDSILGRLRVYLLGHHRRHLTRQPELGSVEWLGHQGALAREEEESWPAVNEMVFGSAWTRNRICLESSEPM